MENVGKEEILECGGSYEDDYHAEDISRRGEERKLQHGSDEEDDGSHENMNVQEEDDGSHENMNVQEEDDGPDHENMNWHEEEEYEEDGSYQRRYTHGRYRQDRNRYGDREFAAFEEIYQCYPPIYADRPELEKANRIIMPPSALSRLLSQEIEIEYPMLFQFQNTITGRISHCGVLEFVAEEGIIYMPLWIMQNMLLNPGDSVKLKHTTLPKGTYLKLQPHTKNFLDISNPRALLEVSLRNFSCLTREDSIKIDYNNTTYCIDIVDTKPESAISVFDTDLEVDFAPPLDYKEPQSEILVPINSAAIENASPEAQCRFTAFTGVGRRLNGKPLSPNIKIKSSRPRSRSRSRSPTRPPLRKPGKLVFGHSTNNIISQSNNSHGKVMTAQKSEKPSEEADKFKPFTGRKYSLKD